MSEILRKKLHDAILAMFKQGRVCKNVDGVCVYYDEPSGRRCLFGHMFSEELVKVVANGGNSGNIDDLFVGPDGHRVERELGVKVVKNTDEGPYVNNPYGLGELQECHDNAESVDDMLERIVELSENEDRQRYSWIGDCIPTEKEIEDAKADNLNSA